MNEVDLLSLIPRDIFMVILRHLESPTDIKRFATLSKCFWEFFIENIPQSLANAFPFGPHISTMTEFAYVFNTDFQQRWNAKRKKDRVSDFVWVDDRIQETERALYTNQTPQTKYVSGLIYQPGDRIFDTKGNMRFFVDNPLEEEHPSVVMSDKYFLWMNYPKFPLFYVPGFFSFVSLRQIDMISIKSNSIDDSVREFLQIPPNLDIAMWITKVGNIDCFVYDGFPNCDVNMYRTPSWFCLQCYNCKHIRIGNEMHIIGTKSCKNLKRKSAEMQFFTDTIDLALRIREEDSEAFDDICQNKLAFVLQGLIKQHTDPESLIVLLAERHRYVDTLTAIRSRKSDIVGMMSLDKLHVGISRCNMLEYGKELYMHLTEFPEDIPKVRAYLTQICEIAKIEYADDVMLLFRVILDESPSEDPKDKTS